MHYSIYVWYICVSIYIIYIEPIHRKIQNTDKRIKGERICIHGLKVSILLRCQLFPTSSIS